MEIDLQQRDDAHVVFEGVTLKFGDRTILRDVNASFPQGKITVILGGSGVGKSTTLRLIGGLLRPEKGRILVDGEDVTRMSNRDLARMRLKLGMLFQKGALLDATTVFDNVALPLREHSKMPEREVGKKVYETLAQVGLEPEDARLTPSQLSGGMIKRVALARAIIMEPVIVLCDEPFSGLDPITARRIELLLQKVSSEQGMTLLVVSHDSASTMRMADHVLAMLPGMAVEGTAEELSASDDPRLANLLTGEVDDALLKLDGLPDWALDSSFDLRSTWS